MYTHIITIILFYHELFGSRQNIVYIEILCTKRNRGKKKFEYQTAYTRYVTISDFRINDIKINTPVYISKILERIIIIINSSLL